MGCVSRCRGCSQNELPERKQVCQGGAKGLCPACHDVEDVAKMGCQNRFWQDFYTKPKAAPCQNRFWQRTAFGRNIYKIVVPFSARLALHESSLPSLAAPPQPSLCVHPALVHRALVQQPSMAMFIAWMPGALLWTYAADKKGRKLPFLTTAYGALIFTEGIPLRNRPP